MNVTNVLQDSLVNLISLNTVLQWSKAVEAIVNTVVKEIALKFAWQDPDVEFMNKETTKNLPIMPKGVHIMKKLSPQKLYVLKRLRKALQLTQNRTWTCHKQKKILLHNDS